MLKAVIFDIDGVLVESERANNDYYKRALAHAGYDDITDEQVHACFHLPMKGAIRKLTGIEDDAKINEIFEDCKKNVAYNFDLLEFPPELEDVLEELHKTYKLGIVTSRIRLGVDGVFRSRDIEQYFSSVVAFEDYMFPKPSGQPLEVAAEQLDIAPEEAVYIGDSPTDIESANAAGMKSIYLSSANHPEAGFNIQTFAGVLGAVEACSDM